MKPFAALLAVAVSLAIGQRANSQTVNWGSGWDVLGHLVDSTGQNLDGSYEFQLGAFLTTFRPSEEDPSAWAANWRTFDTAAYGRMTDEGTSTVYDHFTGSQDILQSGRSSQDSTGMDFQGLNAYVWIRNSTSAMPGTQWLLVRANSWVFPQYTGCCPNDTVLDWSVSDLSTPNPNAVPLFGRQGSAEGWGANTTNDTGVYTLQTYTFVPEPSSALLATLAAACMALRRRRNS